MTRIKPSAKSALLQAKILFLCVHFFWDTEFTEGNHEGTEESLRGLSLNLCDLCVAGLVDLVAASPRQVIRRYRGRRRRRPAPPQNRIRAEMLYSVGTT